MARGDGHPDPTPPDGGELRGPDRRAGHETRHETESLADGRAIHFFSRDPARPRSGDGPR